MFGLDTNQPGSELVDLWISTLVASDLQKLSCTLIHEINAHPSMWSLINNQHNQDFGDVVRLSLRRLYLTPSIRELCFTPTKWVSNNQQMVWSTCIYCLISVHTCPQLFVLRLLLPLTSDHSAFCGRAVPGTCTDMVLSG